MLDFAGKLSAGRRAGGRFSRCKRVSGNIMLLRRRLIGRRCERQRTREARRGFATLCPPLSGPGGVTSGAICRAARARPWYSQRETARQCCPESSRRRSRGRRLDERRLPSRCVLLKTPCLPDAARQTPRARLRLSRWRRTIRDLDTDSVVLRHQFIRLSVQRVQRGRLIRFACVER